MTGRAMPGLIHDPKDNESRAEEADKCRAGTLHYRAVGIRRLGKAVMVG